MPFEPEHSEAELNISASEDAVEKAGEEDFSEGPEGGEELEAAQAHTVRGGTVG